MNENYAANIIIWGLTGSGKTWFINGLGRRFFDSVREQTVSQEEKPKPFSYSLINQRTDLPVFDGETPPLIKPNNDLRLFHYRFEREGRFPGFDYQVSSHCHYITFWDGRGSDLARFTDDSIRSDARMEPEENTDDDRVSEGDHIVPPDNISVPRARDPQLSVAPTDRDRGLLAAAQKALTLCPNLILLLDLGNFNNENYFHEALINLEHLLTKEKFPRRVAFCLPKMDLQSPETGWMSTDEKYLEVFVHQRFPSKGDSILKTMKKFSERLNYTVRLFAVSAAGYLSNDSPNLASTSDGDTVMSLPEWQPINVEQPFSWLLFEMEKERMKEAGKVASNKWWFMRLYDRELISRVRCESIRNYSVD